tara:strand:+ start:103 stop:426 length:324 start_codon:yes stop_codon:yes gene_type:complete
MKVKVYPTNAPMETREVKCFNDIQHLIGGEGFQAVEEIHSRDLERLFPSWELVHFDTQSNESYLVHEEARLINLPKNEHFPAFYGTVVVASSGWEGLPYSSEEVSQK